MPRCLNCPAPPAKGYYYSGDEKTPLGRGYSAKFADGETMKGKDRKKYISQKGRWKLSEKETRISPRGSFFGRSLGPTAGVSGEPPARYMGLKVPTFRPPESSYATSNTWKVNHFCIMHGLKCTPEQKKYVAKHMDAMNAMVIRS